MVATGETVGLAEWIIDDTCLVFSDSNFFSLTNLRIWQTKLGGENIFPSSIFRFHFCFYLAADVNRG